MTEIIVMGAIVAAVAYTAAIIPIARYGCLSKEESDELKDLHNKMVKVLAEKEMMLKNMEAGRVNDAKTINYQIRMIDGLNRRISDLKGRV